MECVGGLGVVAEKEKREKAVCCKHGVKAPFGGITRDVKAWIGGMNESESRLSIHVRHDRP